MAGASSTLDVPGIEVIVLLNHRLIDRYGGEFLGFDNLANRNSLEWVLDVIQHPLFDQDPYPTLAHKAALLAWIINTRHVFIDGNKRTSMAAASLILDKNGYRLTANNNEIVEISLTISKERDTNFSYDNLVVWFESHIVVKSRPASFMSG